MSNRKRTLFILISGFIFLYSFLAYDPNFHGADEPIYYAYTASVVEDGDLNPLDEFSPNFDAFLTTKTCNLPDSHNHGGVILWVPFYIYGKLLYTLSKKFDLERIVYFGLDKITKCVLSFSTVLFGLLMLVFTYLFCKVFFLEQYVLLYLQAQYDFLFRKDQ